MTIDSTVLKRIKEDGLLREGHFAYRSGVHSSGLLDRDRLLTDPAVASRFGYNIARHFFSDHIETVATPSIWGSGLAQWVGYFLEPRARVVDATPAGNGQLLIAEKIADLVKNRRVLLVDNLIISGATMVQFARLTEEMGGKVIGIATLWRSGPESLAGHRIYSVLNDDYPCYPPDDCPVCATSQHAAEAVSY